MGILKLTDLISDEAGAAVHYKVLEDYRDRRLAVDASIFLHQFASSMGYMRHSHLLGTFYRTVGLMELGILPIFVFDGPPPILKAPLLKKRAAVRQVAIEAFRAAKEAAAKANAEATDSPVPAETSTTPGWTELTSAEKRDTFEQECMRMLKLMGVPVIKAKSEAEATCAALVLAGKAYAVATEDMDALPFGTPVLVRGLKIHNNPTLKEICLSEVLAGLKLTQEEFIDLCILLGCDYCESITGMGPKKALPLIRKYHSIEGILKHLDTKKFTVPTAWDFKGARELFKNPSVCLEGVPESLVASTPDEEGLVQFLAVEKHVIKEDRIRKGVERLRFYPQATKQKRIDSIFKSSKRQRKAEQAEEDAAGGKMGKLEDAEVVDDEKEEDTGPPLPINSPACVL
ncbi:flap endonuclease 1-like [Lampetra fluviatilis]